MKAGWAAPASVGGELEEQIIPAAGVTDLSLPRIGRTFEKKIVDTEPRSALAK